MKEHQLLNILNQHVNEYIDNIAIELESSHDQWFDSFGFPVFGETSKEYHEQVYFQSYLESYTRKMINRILEKLFDEEYDNEIKWPEFEINGIYNGYTNIEYEQEYGFEFVDLDDRIGYRYTGIQIDEIDSILSKYNIGTIVQVVWKGEDDIIGFGYSDDRIKAISIWDLFVKLFYDLSQDETKALYNTFIATVTSAVEKANSMISLTTMPGFTSSYMHRNRNSTIQDLQKEINGLSAFFVRNWKFKKTQEDSKQLISKYNLHKYFLNRKMEYAFVGRTQYAKSYMTSNYLFTHLKNNQMFDYTPIVSGYIKSIEQLLDVICSSYCDEVGDNTNMGSYTLGDYTIYIDNNENILRPELRAAKQIIVNCLVSYRKESRNKLFHKHYLNSWDKVEMIRLNTIFLYVVLLGAVDSSFLYSKPDVLGILNLEYDQLFDIIDTHSNQWFTFVIDGKEYSCMEKEPRNKGIVFNQNGMIKNTIIFSRFDYDHYERIEISWARMPSEIWAVDVFGNKEEKLWPVSP